MKRTIPKWAIMRSTNYLKKKEFVVQLKNPSGDWCDGEVLLARSQTDALASYIRDYPNRRGLRRLILRESLIYERVLKI